MKITDWLGRLVKPPKAGQHDVTTYRIEKESSAASAACIDAYALFTAVGMIARLMSGCEFKTFRNNSEYKGIEWAALNFKPNKEQNGTEFKREMVSRLLLTGEVLVIRQNKESIIADSFSKNESAVYGYVFTQVSRGNRCFDRSFRSDEVFYLTSPVNAKEIWLQGLMAQYEKLMRSASERFEKADGERGTLKVSALAKGDPAFETTFNNLMNDYFKGYFNAKNAVLPLFDGYEYSAQTSGRTGTYTNDTTAVKTIADEALGKAAQAFGIPASYIHGDAAGISDAQSAMLTNCIKPLAALISAEITAKQYTLDEIAQGDRTEVDTGSILHHDIIGSGDKLDKLFGSGWSHNEIRQALGQPVCPESWANEHFITKNYGSIEEALKGGETDA